MVKCTSNKKKLPFVPLQRGLPRAIYRPKYAFWIYILKKVWHLIDITSLSTPHSFTGLRGNISGRYSCIPSSGTEGGVGQRGAKIINFNFSKCRFQKLLPWTHLGQSVSESGTLKNPLLLFGTLPSFKFKTASGAFQELTTMTCQWDRSWTPTNKLLV